MMISSSTVDDNNNTNNACFCSPWSRSRAPAISLTTDQIPGAYTDADLAADMNALTFEERQYMEEDVHGVADVIEETPEFVTQKIEEMKVFLEANKSPKRAWDRAVFLRPALADDRRLYLMFLQARRFQSHDAARTMAAYFEAKRDLWGDDLLIHRITWNDLTEEEQRIFRTGSHRTIPNGDRTGRGVSVARVSEYDIGNDVRPYVRRAFYAFAIVEDDPIMQQRGIVMIADFRGKWKSSALQILHQVASYPMTAVPFHEASAHILYNDPGMNDVIQTLRRIFSKRLRMRTRLHFGSPVELEYTLRSFGVDVSRCSLAAVNPSLDGDADSDYKRMLNECIDEDIRIRQNLDDEWRRSEAPYCDPSSPIALFPNPQDIIMGRNKAGQQLGLATSYITR